MSKSSLCQKARTSHFLGFPERLISPRTQVDGRLSLLAELDLVRVEGAVFALEDDDVLLPHPEVQVEPRLVAHGRGEVAADDAVVHPAGRLAVARVPLVELLLDVGRHVLGLLVVVKGLPVRGKGRLSQKTAKKEWKRQVGDMF
jgi:hypothetical protein